MAEPKDHRDNRRKQVRLTGFENGPMARLAEQRLWQSDIPCFIRSMRGGPGLWRSAYNLPHDLDVFETDRARAGEVLELELAELDTGKGMSAPARSNGGFWLAGVVLAAVLVVGMILRLTSVQP